MSYYQQKAQEYAEGYVGDYDPEEWDGYKLYYEDDIEELAVTIENAMRMAAKDQRHACAEALLDVPAGGYGQIHINAATSAVMNAEIEGGRE